MSLLSDSGCYLLCLSFYERARVGPSNLISTSPFVQTTRNQCVVFHDLMIVNLASIYL